MAQIGLSGAARLTGKEPVDDPPGDEDGAAVVIINKGEPPTFEEELAQDVIEIITVFSARLYGSRSHKTKRLLNELTERKEAESDDDPFAGEFGGPGDEEDEEVVLLTDKIIAELLAAMSLLQTRAMAVYARMAEEHDASGP